MKGYVLQEESHKLEEPVLNFRGASAYPLVVLLPCHVDQRSLLLREWSDNIKASALIESSLKNSSPRKISGLNERVMLVRNKPLVC